MKKTVFVVGLLALTLGGATGLQAGYEDGPTFFYRETPCIEEVASCYCNTERDEESDCGPLLRNCQIEENKKRDLADRIRAISGLPNTGKFPVASFADRLSKEIIDMCGEGGEEDSGIHGMDYSDIFPVPEPREEAIKRLLPVGATSEVYNDDFFEQYEYFDEPCKPEEEPCLENNINIRVDVTDSEENEELTCEEKKKQCFKKANTLDEKNECRDIRCREPLATHNPTVETMNVHRSYENLQVAEHPRSGDVIILPPVTCLDEVAQCYCDTERDEESECGRLHRDCQIEENKKKEEANPFRLISVASKPSKPVASFRDRLSEAIDNMCGDERELTCAEQRRDCLGRNDSGISTMSRPGDNPTVEEQYCKAFYELCISRGEIESLSNETKPMLDGDTGRVRRTMSRPD
ncbi:MAG: hypothetical protein Q7S68_03210 [Deltaproteobacteria bacterium]|nr:hypothetical protein [Deltaproteobacteria bacterium]